MPTRVGQARHLCGQPCHLRPWKVYSIQSFCSIDIYRIYILITLEYIHLVSSHPYRDPTTRRDICVGSLSLVGGEIHGRKETRPKQERTYTAARRILQYFCRQRVSFAVQSELWNVWQTANISTTKQNSSLERKWRWIDLSLSFNMEPIGYFGKIMLFCYSGCSSRKEIWRGKKQDKKLE